MTPKNCNDQDSDYIMKDIEGHAIEKITTSKLNEKAQQEKWRIEEEELEKVRIAREILRNLKSNGISDIELIEKAKQLSKQMIKPSEISGMVMSDKSELTNKSNVKYCDSASKGQVCNMIKS